MRAAEQRHLLDQVGGFPAQPWLWLSPCATWLPAEAPAGRGVRLHRAADGRGWDGDVCCALPLPLPLRNSWCSTSTYHRVATKVRPVQRGYWLKTSSAVPVGARKSSPKDPSAAYF